MLQGIIRCDSRLWVIVQHSQYQVFKLQVVGHCVTWLSCPSTAGTPSFRTNHVVKLPGSMMLVLEEIRETLIATVANLKQWNMEKAINQGYS